MTQATNTAATNRQDNDAIDIGFLLGSLWDYKIFIAVMAVIFTAAGLVYATLQTPIYQADALVQVEKKSGTIPGADMGQMLGGKGGNDTSTEIEIFRSRMILGKVVNQTDLDIAIQPTSLPVLGDWPRRKGITRPGFMEGKPSVWAGETLEIKELVTSHATNTMVMSLQSLGNGRYLLKDAQGSELGQGIVGQKLTVEEPWLELTVAELNAPAGAVFTVVKRSHLSAIGGLKGRLGIQDQRGTGILRLTLSGPDRDELVRSLNATTQVFLTQNVARQAAEAEKSLEFLEEQAPKLREQLNEAENRLNEYRLQSDSIDLSFETQNALNSLVSIEASLNELQLQETELARRFTPNHPVYRSLLEKKEQLLREKARLEERTGNLPETQQQILRLSRDVKVTQEIYVQLLNRMQELRLARAGTVGNVRILDDAVVQGQVAPKRNLIVAVAGMSGLLLAMIIVLLRAAFNRGIVSPEQLEDLDLPVYATVPLSEEENRRSAKGKKAGKRKAKSKGGLLAVRNPADLSIEAIRGLRTSLHFAMMEGSNNRLVITGPSPAIGKSFMASNLAAICAQAGQKVVVVDGDMRKGHVHEAFKQDSHNGLSEVLSGKLEFAQAVKTSEVEGLSWVSRGSAPPNPSELLMQARFTEFLDYLSEHFDLVIIDTPPILAVTDAAIIGKQCGTTLMVVRFGQNTPKEIQIAENRLATGGVTVKGTILNAMEKKAATSYGYYGYYNYSYKSE